MFVELAFASMLAQQQTTTCIPMGVGVQCQTTQQQDPMDSFNRGMENGARMGEALRRARENRDPGRCAGGDWWMVGCSRGEHDEAREAREAQARASDARGQVMNLLRSGDCQGAVVAALDTGDLGFATEVRTFCAAGD